MPSGWPWTWPGRRRGGATAYVTLEPCAHHGRTPPCAEGLVQAGVARVVSALTDPDPRVSGRGLAILRAAGIAVTEGVLEAEARALQAGFLSRVTRGRPMVTLKLASGFDGRIAMPDGESRWITGPAARAHVHLLRARHDAVMVGGGTARADLPQLNVRGLTVPRQPVRVVVSSAPLPALPPEGPAHGPLWRLAGPLDEVLADLGARGLTRVFCEGGGVLAAGLLRAGLVDELVGYTAGVVLGSEGRAAVGPAGWPTLADAPRFSLIETRPIGGDVLHRWQRA